MIKFSYFWSKVQNYPNIKRIAINAIPDPPVFPKNSFKTLLEHRWKTFERQSKSTHTFEIHFECLGNTLKVFAIKMILKLPQYETLFKITPNSLKSPTK